jgi:spoIIIJ-associated protein
VEWVVTSGRTIEEATELALDQLGVDEHDAEIEVVQEAQKGLFGRLRAEAQVRARVRPTTPRPKLDRRDRRRGDRRSREGARSRRGSGGGGAGGRDAGGGGRAGGASSERLGAGVAASTTTGTRDARAAVQADDASDAGSGRNGDRAGASGRDAEGGDQGGGGSAKSSKSANRRRRRSRGPRTAEGATVSESTNAAEQPVDEVDIEAQRAAVETFLTDLVGAFGRSDATVAVNVSDDDGALEAAVEGPELGLLVGQKGVTLQAVQELVRSMVQRQFVGQSHARVRVDVAGYRARRKAALERFAAGVAESVRESGVAKALDPMGSADRKVVHDAVNDIDGVVTVSEGEDSARRVVIRPA